MSKLWQQNDSTDELSKAVNQFTVEDDFILDQHLVPYDIKASKAHASGLLKTGILSQSEVTKLHGALDKLLKKWKNDDFIIKQEQEDCHTAIEQFLVDELGKTGKKIHAGRSRNDQVLVAMRLFEKDQLSKLSQKVLSLTEVFIGKAEAHADIPMPGYTHTQKAMPSSVGMWLSAIAEMLLMDLENLKSAFSLVNRCPLGTAAGFGVNIDLPREEISEALGFAEPIVVSLTAQNTRGKIDLKLMEALETIGSTLGHFANDLILYTSQEFNFFTLNEALYTGSSIMPQKRNIDAAELIRARSGNLSGDVQAVKMITHKMYSGYHRDYQAVKKHVMQSLDELNGMIDMSWLMVDHLKPNREVLISACTPELFAADRANELVKQGMSFRDSYHQVKKEETQAGEVDPVENIKNKTHLGSTGNLGLERLKIKADSFHFG